MYFCVCFYLSFFPSETTPLYFLCFPLSNVLTGVERRCSLTWLVVGPAKETAPGDSTLPLQSSLRSCDPSQGITDWDLPPPPRLSRRPVKLSCSKTYLKRAKMRELVFNFWARLFSCHFCWLFGLEQWISILGQIEQ